MRHALRPAIAAVLLALATTVAQADDPLDCKNHYILEGPCVAVGPMVVTHATPTGSAPADAAIDATTGHVYVANSGTGRLGGGDPSITVVRPDGTSVTLPMTTTPMRIAASDTFRKVVVSNGGFGPLGATILDSETLAHRFVALGYLPTRALFDPARPMAYVAGDEPDLTSPPPPYVAPAKGSFSVIDLAAGTFRTIPLARTPQATVQVASRSRVYVAMHGPRDEAGRARRGWLQAYDTASQSLVGEPRALPGRQIRDLFASADGSKLFVLGHVDGTAPHPTEGTPWYIPVPVLWVVDAETLDVVATHALPYLPVSLERSTQFQGQALFDAPSNKLYALGTFSQQLFSVDVTTGAVAQVVTEGAARGFGINPSARTLVVVFDPLGQAGTYSLDLERLDSIPLGAPTPLGSSSGNYPVVSSPSSGLTYVAYNQERAMVRFTLPSAQKVESLVNLTDIWWDPSEPGFGLYVDQQGVRTFVAMFNRDGSWVVMPDSRREAGGSFSGALYRTQQSSSGPRPATMAGVLKFTAYAENVGRIEYTLDGATRARDIVRYDFGGERNCSWANPTLKAANASTNFTTLWSNPADQGWGLSLSQRGDTMVGILYDYDAQGSPVWSMLASAPRAGDGSFTGTVYRSGSGGIYEVGTLSMSFDTAGTGALQTSIDGAAKSRPIARHVYAAPLSDCH